MNSSPPSNPQKPNPHDAKSTEPGDGIVVLVGSFDPPTMDHWRAVEALLARPDVKHVWLAPLHGENNDKVMSMTMLLATDLAAGHKQPTVCTVALDKKLTDTKELMSWIRGRYTANPFRLAAISPDAVEDSYPTIKVAFGPGAGTTGSTESVVLDKFLPVPADVKARIQGGSDESRNFPAPVWEYIQRHKLYRG